MKNSVKCIINCGEEILFIKHRDWPQGWVLPGGTMEKDETAGEAVRREIKEEVSIELAEVQKFYRLELEDETVYCFESIISDREAVKADGKEAIEAKWFLSSKLPTQLGTRSKQVISAWNSQ